MEQGRYVRKKTAPAWVLASLVFAIAVGVAWVGVERYESKARADERQRAGIALADARDRPRRRSWNPP